MKLRRLYEIFRGKIAKQVVGTFSGLKMNDGLDIVKWSPPPKREKRVGHSRGYVSPQERENIRKWLDDGDILLFSGT
jgi:hypothetical protein